MAASGLSSEEVFPWLKTLPLAPEYHPTIAEFQDPIAYIFKIEKEASQYGICKIVPPVQPASKKTAIANLNRSLAARAAANGASSSKSAPTFTTRQQQIGFCPRKPRPVQRPVWQSGENYTFQEFEAKAKSFEKNYLKKCGKKGALSALETETLYWKASVDKPFSVEYANDMPGSAFVPVSTKRSGARETGDGVTLGETAWNMRGVSRANGSLLRFMKEEIPGVTSPMVYVAMMFSWFAWHVEDHDLHSLNYLHMGAGKTWYGVPREAAVAFEEVVRVHGYGGEINPLVTFATLGEKTTVMSPEVFISAGVPCCRLVQNAGEFVVTFPRAYHSGFSHGFNCGEASNIATPEWLRVAKDAAIRRASINYPPMVSHFQLLYDLALALCSRVPLNVSAKPRSLRLKDRKRGEGETLVKELFVRNVIQNNNLLHILGKGSSIILLPQSSSDISVCSDLRVGSQLRVKPVLSIGLHTHKEAVNPSQDSRFDHTARSGHYGIKPMKGLYSVKGKFVSFCGMRNHSSFSGDDNLSKPTSRTEHMDTERENAVADGLSDQRLFSCVTCGILSFACVAVIQPREPAARYLASADCSFFNDWIVGSGVTGNEFVMAAGDATTSDLKSGTNTGWTEKSDPDRLYDVPVQSANYQIQKVDQSKGLVSETGTEGDASALGLLAINYGNSSDSEEDQVEADVPVYGSGTKLANNSSEREHQHDDSGSKQDFLDNATGVLSHSLSRINSRDKVPCQAVDIQAERGRERSDLKDKSHQTYNFSVELGVDNLASVKSNGLESKHPNQIAGSQITSNASPGGHGAETAKFGDTFAQKSTVLPFAPRCDEDSSRLHIFCLEHAVEIEQQLRPIGGVQISLLCHPEYLKIEAEAKSAAEELGIEHLWNEITFKDAAKEDEERIRAALDSEEAIPGNGDWAVKLGINLFYSANLSRSPLYSKQMPYNSVIYNAFGRDSPGGSPTKFSVHERKTVRQKKLVAGKWCGKVWMSNQVHPFLAQKDPEEEEQEKRARACPTPYDNLERKAGSARKTENAVMVRKFARKRKTTVESRSVKKVKHRETEKAVSDDLLEDDSLQQGRRIFANEPVADFSKQENAVSYDSMEDNSHKQHIRTYRRRQSKNKGREGADTDNAPGNSSYLPYRRIPRSKRTKYHEGDDAISDDIPEDVSYRKHEWKSIGKQARSDREDSVSDDALDHRSHDRGWRTSRSKVADLMEDEDAVSEYSVEDYVHRQPWKVSRSSKAQSFDTGDPGSDESMEDTGHRQSRSISRSMDVEEEDAFSDDSLGNNHTHQQHMKIARSNRVKCFKPVSDDSPADSSYEKSRRSMKTKFVEREDAVSDDSLENSSYQQNRRIRRSKQAKHIEREDAVSCDSLEDDDSHRQQPRRRSSRSKLVKSCDREDTVSYGTHMKVPRTRRSKHIEDEAVSGDLLDDDDDVDVDSHQQQGKVLRGKQLKTETTRQMKKLAARQVKRAPHTLMKQEAPRVRNVKRSLNTKEFSPFLEEELEGGPSTRLRKRYSETKKELGSNLAENSKQTGKKKAKGKSAVKAQAGYSRVKVKDEETEFQCDIEGCSMSFGSKQELVLHKRNICPVKGCGKKFFSHKYLVQHRRVHLDDRPLKCPWKGCKMTFKWAWARTEHIRVHTGARPYVCAEPGCGQTFRFVSDFSRHKRKTGHSTKKSRG